MNPFERRDPDLDVVLLAQRRSTRSAAMGILYERFRERIYNVALRIVLDREEARDVLHDVIVLLFRKIRRFKAKAAFASWVYRITVNMSLDHVRRRRRAPKPASDPEILDREQTADGLTLPERGLARRDLQGHVQQALGRLSERLRIVVVLRYLEGLAYADIAEILGCSVGTVKSRLNRAHSALRGELAVRYDRDASHADARGA